MAAANAPICTKETLTLSSLGITPQFISFTHVTMESDKYVCVCVTSPLNSVVIIDMSMPKQPFRRPITADSALMNPNSRILALKGESEPVKMFDRMANLANSEIIKYRCDPTEKWFVLIGIARGSERPQLVRGNMQVFSVDQQWSQALEAHAASFASFKVPGNENPSVLFTFASKSVNAGQITSKLHVIELGAQPGKPSFTEKQADLSFPPDFADDFPVAMQISHKYSLIYVITKRGLLFVYDLETATAIYRNRISPDPIFLTAEASSVGGFYAINRRGQVLLVTVNEATIVPFVSGQLNNLELAVSLAKRGNLPGAENSGARDKLKANYDKAGQEQAQLIKEADGNAYDEGIGVATNFYKKQVADLMDKAYAAGYLLGLQKAAVPEDSSLFKVVPKYPTEEAQVSAPAATEDPLTEATKGDQAAGGGNTENAPEGNVEILD